MWGIKTNFTNASAKLLMFCSSKFVVGSSSVRMPHRKRIKGMKEEVKKAPVLAQKQSASASRIISDVITFWPKIRFECPLSKGRTGRASSSHINLLPILDHDDPIIHPLDIRTNVIRPESQQGRWRWRILTVSRLYQYPSLCKRTASIDEWLCLSPPFWSYGTASRLDQELYDNWSDRVRPVPSCDEQWSSHDI